MPGQDALRPVLLRRMKEDVENLPDKEEVVVWVELTPEQRHFYRAIFAKEVRPPPSGPLGAVVLWYYVAADVALVPPCVTHRACAPLVSLVLVRRGNPYGSGSTHARKWAYGEIVHDCEAVHLLSAV